ncbi:efflux RND transporter periplasmic adaptor subunit [Lysobacter xanthus]
MTRTSWLAIAAIVVAAVLVFGYLRGRREQAAEAKTEAALVVDRKATVEGVPTLVLTAAEQTAAGVVVARPAQASVRDTTSAVAVVVSAADLSALRAELGRTRAELASARAKAAASAAQAARLRTLRVEAQDASLTEVQAVEATLAADRAAADAAQSALRSAEEAATLKWGAELARAVSLDTTLFRRIADGRDALLQVTLPSGVAAPTLPPTLAVGASGVSTTARLLGRAAQSDPRLQGSSFYYVAPNADLRTGAAVTVELPTGHSLRGGVLPASAVVSWQGRHWAYTRRDATHFVRRLLPENAALADGWVVPAGFAGDQPVVVQGAELMLSEELRASLQGDEE